MTTPIIPPEDPATWGPKEGPPAGLQGMDGTGFWVPCEALGWPLEAMGKDAAVYVLPTPTESYRHALREAVGDHDLGTPAARFAVEAALPGVFARHAMTAMRGIRLQTGGPILEDTPDNRELALRTSSILLDRVQAASQAGPPGDTWRDIAIRQRQTLGEVNALVMAGLFQGVSPDRILREVNGRVICALGHPQMVLLPLHAAPAVEDDGEDGNGGEVPS